MKNTLALVCLILTGCVINRPILTETTEKVGTNSTVTTRTLKVTSVALWPATQQVEKQKASLGKTFSLGQDGFTQEGGGTNVVEALRSIDSILGKVRP